MEYSSPQRAPVATQWLRRALWHLFKPLRHWAHTTQFTAHTHRCVTLKIHFLAPDNALINIMQALDVIAEEDPSSFEKIKEHLSGGITVGTDRQAAAHYVNATRTCYLSPDTAET